MTREQLITIIKNRCVYDKFGEMIFSAGSAEIIAEEIMQLYNSENNKEDKDL